jgi:hypothetical protein
MMRSCLRNGMLLNKSFVVLLFLLEHPLEVNKECSEGPGVSTRKGLTNLAGDNSITLYEI